MRRITWKHIGAFAVAAAVGVFTADSAFAQRGDDRPEGERGDRPERGERGERGEGRFGGRFGGPGGPGGDPGEMMRRFNPMFAALDADEDGEISEKEIENATAALKKLDKNSDGKLTAEELRPEFPGRGERGPRDGEGPRGDRGPRDGDRPGGGDAVGMFVDRMKQLDKNGDGSITKDELPEGRGERMLTAGDTNSDGKLDSTEIKAMAERAAQNRGDRGPRGGDRPE